MTELEELKIKVKNEVKTGKDLRSLFRDMEDEFYIYYLATGLLPDFSSFAPELESLLKKNYRKIGKDFKFNARDEFDLQLSDNISNKIDENISRRIFKHAPLETALILATSNKRIRDFFNIAESKTQKDKALEVKKMFKHDNNSRSKTIAQTEVQNMSEFTKSAEATEIVASGAVVLKKKWSATFDAKTRPAHARANGQTKFITEPYIVKGEQLMYPGDTSLGASAGNIINCRCSSRIVI